MYNLSGSYRDRGRLEASAQIGEEALEGFRKLVGPDNPYFLRTLDSLAVNYGLMGRLQEAESYSIPAVEGLRRTLGPGHLDTITIGSTQNIAKIYLHMGRIGDLFALRFELVEICKRTYGADHSTTLHAMRSLAQANQDMKRWPEAGALAKQAVETCKRQYGLEHLETILGMTEMTFDFLLQGRFAEAEANLMEMLRARRRLLDREDPPTQDEFDGDMAHTAEFQERDLEHIDSMANRFDEEALY